MPYFISKEQEILLVTSLPRIFRVAVKP